jgi:hypothetical protein
MFIATVIAALIVAASVAAYLRTSHIEPRFTVTSDELFTLAHDRVTDTMIVLPLYSRPESDVASQFTVTNDELFTVVYDHAADTSIVLPASR